MKKTIGFFLTSLLLSCAQAIDVNPTRQTVPDQFVNPPGKRFSIFSGDPERVQRANEVKVEDFKASIEFTSKNYSLKELREIADRNPSLEIVFIVQNTNPKHNYILSFPDAQRYDFMIKDANGNVLYTWSDDKVFVKEVGKIFVNGSEKISFRPSPEIILTPLLSKLKPGIYKIHAALSNYPEIQAEAEWLLKP